jgi:hypothetical protein
MKNEYPGEQKTDWVFWHEMITEKLKMGEWAKNPQCSLDEASANAVAHRHLTVHQTWY